MPAAISQPEQGSLSHIESALKFMSVQATDPKILDFGCGEGKLVALLRKQGYDAWGFEIHNVIDVAEPAYQCFFAVLDNPMENTADFSLDWSKFRLPYQDGSFDLVYSSQVFEHLQNYDAVLAELARILKPGGMSINVYPPRYKIIETHTLVPGASLICNYYYYLFWALLGVRNQYQKELSAKVTACLNFAYAKTGLNYLSLGKLQKKARKYFSRVEYSPQTLYKGRFFSNKYLIKYHTFFRETVLLLQNE